MASERNLRADQEPRFGYEFAWGLMKAALVKLQATRTDALTGGKRLRTALLKTEIALVTCLALLQCVLMFKALHGRATQRDFTVYYLSAKALDSHLNPYMVDFSPTVEKLGYDTGGVTHATDPPTFVLMLAPLAHLPIERAFWAWTAINALCFAVSIFLLFGPYSQVSPYAAWALAPLFVWYPPISGHFFFGQSKMPLLLMLSLMMRLMDWGLEGAAGIALAFAILTRAFPVVIIGYLMLQRRWRTLAYTAISLAAGGILTLVLLGPTDTLSFTRGISTLTHDHWAAMVQNLSLNAFILRIFWVAAAGQPYGLIDQIRRLTVICANLVVLWLTVRATLSSPTREDPDWRLLSLWIATSVILSPIAWFYYEVLFLILFAQLAAAASHGRVSRRALAMAAASCFIILAWVCFFTEIGGDAPTWPQRLLREGGFFSMVAAYVAAYWFAMDRVDAAPVPLLGLPVMAYRRLVGAESRARPSESSVA